MSKPISIVLVGISGMGSVYVQELLEKRESGKFEIKGAVDPWPERCPHLVELQKLDIPIFKSLEKFYKKNRAELAIISSPIHFHSPQTQLALSQGSHVLCEKPISATIQEARGMIKAKEKAGKWVAIGFQWSFSTAIQELKKDILKGIFGKPRLLRCLYLWPREKSYYLRNDWAGKKCDSQGNWILDSPMNNAMAHDLHNMFYILGKKREESILPLEVEAELFRAYDIQNFDSGAARCLTEKGVEILFYASHASFNDCGPIFSYEFSRGAVFGRGRNSEIKARFEDGSVKNYGCPESRPLQKLWDALRSVRGKKDIACGLEAAMSQTLCLNGIQDSMPEIMSFPKKLLHLEEKEGKQRIWVEGLDEVFKQCYEKCLLPSEMGVSWSRKGRKISLTNYKTFPCRL